MRPHSPERPKLRRSSSFTTRAVSPSICYSDATEAMMEPISPKSATRRSLGMDEATYNMLFMVGGSNNEEDAASSPSDSSKKTEQIGSCPRNLLIPSPRVGDQASDDGAAAAASTKEGEEKADPDCAFSPTQMQTVSAGDMAYQPEEVLAEGWLEKKGTGQDWLGSRGWKPRWARLCLARAVEAEKEDLVKLSPKLQQPQQQPKTKEDALQVPLLLLYWFPASSQVSTAIVLDSTVVLGVDLEGKTNPYRFEVRHATTKNNATLPTTTRTFAAPQRARDAWVYAISQALLQYAKAKDRARKSPASTSNLATSPRVSPRGVVMGLEDEYPWNRAALTDRMSKQNSSPLPLSPGRPGSPPLASSSRLPRAARPTPQRSNSTPI